MDITIKELSSFEEFEEIASLQDRIWHLSDKDKISTITLRSLSMTYPLMGIILGAFHSETMVGFVICMPTREPQTLYGLIMGVLPDYQNSEVGNQLGIKVLEKCLQQNITKICWTYDPLESLHGHLYLNKWGGVVVSYEQNYYQLKNEHTNKIPMDRFIVDCNLKTKRVIERISQKVIPPSVSDVLLKYPIATSSNMPNANEVLVRIPQNFKKLESTQKEQAYASRMETRSIFEEYINKRSYFITNMYSEEMNGERQNYYLMEKRNYL
jgi:predicted GNAT superfamily acetyltransferase